MEGNLVGVGMPAVGKVLVAGVGTGDNPLLATQSGCTLFPFANPKSSHPEVGTIIQLLTSPCLGFPCTQVFTDDTTYLIAATVDHLHHQGCFQMRSCLHSSPVCRCQPWQETKEHLASLVLLLCNQMCSSRWKKYQALYAEEPEQHKGK